MAWFAAALVVVVGASWGFPPASLGEGPALGERDVARTDPPHLPAVEDLTAFLDGKRWGDSLREIQSRIAAAQGQRTAATMATALKELGYVGLVVDPDAKTALLRLPDGRVRRLHPGEKLPDGRVLAAVTGNSLKLRTAAGAEEVLDLFPPLPAEARIAPE